jgi:hypothetical protein
MRQARSRRKTCRVCGWPFVDESRTNQALTCGARCSKTLRLRRQGRIRAEKKARALPAVKRTVAKRCPAKKTGRAGSAQEPRWMPTEVDRETRLEMLRRAMRRVDREMRTGVNHEGAESRSGAQRRAG